MNRSAINEDIRQSYLDINNWLKNQALEKFEQGPEGKWDTSQHLDHIIQTAQMITKALKYPKFVLRYKFGKPNRPIRPKEDVIQRYQEKLKLIPAGVTAPMTINKHPAENKSQIMDALSHSNEKLIKTINKWHEDKLDKHLLPHPLMGRMIIREMIMWHSYHNLHHLNILKEKY